MTLTRVEVEWYFNLMKSRGRVNSNMEFELFRDRGDNIVIGYQLVESREKKWWKRYSFVVSKNTIISEIRQQKLDDLLD